MSYIDDHASEMNEAFADESDRLRKHGKLYDAFMDTLDKVSACPYCDNPKEEQSLCCGEVHDETLWDNGEEYFREEELEGAFKAWLAKRGESGVVA
jgi:hypothetical protein